MAIYRDTRYPGRFAARTTNYPQGAFKNKSSPNATDGSYAEQAWLNDWDGFFGRLLTVANVTPNGTVDNASSSQYYDALMTIITMQVPTGMLINCAGLISSTQFLLADGSAKSRATYANLFSVIGTTYGAGDGSTTFNLPDARAEFLRGADLGRGVDPNRKLGSTQSDAFAKHDHTYAVAGSPSVAGSYVYGRGGDLAGNGVVSTVGDTETRPRNLAVAVYIKI